MNGPAPVIELADIRRTRRVQVALMGEQDLGALYEGIVALAMNRMPPFEQFAAVITRTEMLALLLLDHSGQPIGFSTIQNISSAGHAEFGIYVAAEYLGSGIGAEATCLSIQRAFCELPDLRKLYFVTTDMSKPAFGVAVDVVEPEMVLKDHYYFRGRLWDAWFYSVDRGEWSVGGARFVETLAARKPTVRR